VIPVIPVALTILSSAFLPIWRHNTLQHSLHRARAPQVRVHAPANRAGCRDFATVLLLTPENPPVTVTLMKQKSFSPCGRGMCCALSNPIDAAARQVL